MINQRTVILSTIVLVLAAGLLGQGSHMVLADTQDIPPVFRDVPVNHPTFKAIQTIGVEGIAEVCRKGEPGGPYFCPELPTTRGELALMIARAIYGAQLPGLSRIKNHPCLQSLPSPQPEDVRHFCFSDVNYGQETDIVRAIDALARYRIVRGVVENNQRRFKPASNVTRGEAMGMIMGALMYPQTIAVVPPVAAPPPPPGVKPSPAWVFVDLDAGTPNKDAILTGVKFGIVAGYEDGTFQPENEVTRADAAQLLCNTFLHDCNSSPIKAQLGWSYVSPGIKWRTSDGGPTEENIAVIDLNAPGINVELGYALRDNDYKAGIFRLKNIAELAQHSGAYFNNSNTVEAYHPFVTINGAGFECRKSVGSIPAEHGEIPRVEKNNGVLALKEPVGGPVQPGVPIPGTTHIYKSQADIRGRCASFLTYRKNSDSLALLHTPNETQAGGKEFLGVSTCNAFSDPNWTKAGEYLLAAIVDQQVDFAIGYEATIIHRPAQVDQAPAIRIPAHLTGNEYRTILGIRYEIIDPGDAFKSRASHLYLATVNNKTSLATFAAKLVTAGVQHALLLDNGESSQFLGLGKDELIYNNVVEEGFLNFGLLCEEFAVGKPRKMINSVVVYDSSKTLRRTNLSDDEYQQTGTAVHFPPALLRADQAVAFVIDDTGSMGEEIDDAKRTVNQKVDEFVRQNLSLTYHLMSFKDSPTYRGNTADPAIVKNLVNALGVSGGGDCPEDSLGALNQIADKAPDSDAWLMTDASFHGGVGDVTKTIFNLVRAGVKVHPIIYSWCGLTRATGEQEGNETNTNVASSAAPLLGSETMAQIADETGGHYFRITSAETQAATSILLNEMVVAAEYGVETDQVTLGITKTYPVVVDGTTTTVNFLLNTLSGRTALTLFDPTGVEVKPSDMNITYTVISNAEYYQVMAPALGTWQAQVSGDGEFAFSSSGDSPVVLEYLSDTSLAKGQATRLRASLIGPVASATFRLVNLDGSLAELLNLFDDGLHSDGQAHDGIFGGDYTPTANGSFRLQVQGVISESIGLADVNRQMGVGQAATFERIAPEILRVQTLNVVAPTEPITSSGSTLVYEFVITNGGDVEDTFDLTVSSDQGWANLGSVPTFIRILAGATVRVPIVLTIPPTAGFEMQDETTLVAVSQLNPFINDAASVVTRIGAPVLAVTVSPEEVDEQGRVEPGGIVVFDVVVENLGRVPMQNAALRAFIPDHTSFNAEQSSGWSVGSCSNTVAGGECVYIPTAVEPGAKTVLQFGVNVERQLPDEIKNVSLTVALAVDNLSSSPIVQTARVDISDVGQIFLPIVQR